MGNEARVLQLGVNSRAMPVSYEGQIKAGNVTESESSDAVYRSFPNKNIP